MSQIKVSLIPLKSGYLSLNNPLGCEALAGHLEWCFNRDVDVDIHDHRFCDDNEIVSAIEQHKPHIIGFSAYVGSMEHAKTLIQQIQKRPSLSNSLIVVGNLLATFAYKDILEYAPNVVCVRGHGEIALQQICNILLRHYNSAANGRSALEILHQHGIHEIRNLAYKVLGTQDIITTKQLPTDPTQVGPTKFASIHDVIARGGSIDIRTSYGCSGHCTFCSIKALNATDKFYAFSPERVVNEFRFIYEQGYRQPIGFTDDNFWARSLDQMETLILSLESLKKEVGERIPFKVSSRADNVIRPSDTPRERAQRAQLWHRLADVGLNSVFIGFESASNPQLRRYGKAIRKEVNYQAYRFLTEQLRIRVEMGFIPIDPLMNNEWRQTMRENLAFVKATRMYEYSPSFLCEMRALEGASYLKMLEYHRLKRNLIPGTLEYDYEYLHDEVKQFVSWLEPFFSTRNASSNPYYMLKNTIKVMKRNGRVSEELFALSNMLAYAEMDFVEGLLDVDFNHRWVGNFLREQCINRICSVLHKMKESLAHEATLEASQIEMLDESLEQAIEYFDFGKFGCSPRFYLGFRRLIVNLPT